MTQTTELQAGTELDAEIARRVFGKSGWCGAKEPHMHIEDGVVDSCYPKHYSTDIAAAWLVVEKIPQLEIRKNGDQYSVTVPYRRAPGFGWQGTKDELPEMICRAALAALEAG